MKFPVVFLVCSAVSFGAIASSEYQHFKAIPSETLTEAICNLQRHQPMLAELVNQPEMSAEDMVKIHELTYTLEMALQRIEVELEQAEEQLERVHVGSERMAKDDVKANASAYLATLKPLLMAPDCQ
ncbi:hypothetical protein Fbal_2073 [Ferrimonas balearica DSM 9799]|uniref:Uncharacterized protein n=1 Tax=Ferrimonas balearica (strain DSM 9799 / CCM 4581 / KCTC 23876 / PAT) TaxID=550540 RepID=E1SUE3_FERBD|nr:DUF6746 family protein [Ferrimonas balearica]ADN76276.1 hypothetical protein Fbal_2073 [Ferrimonas balearica DSM 9799]MBY5980920.1 hypothetical protein [Ferrimonas balearica]